ncbi:hypothetical protein ACLOJK_015980 [Asimina triloba]
MPVVACLRAIVVEISDEKIEIIQRAIQKKVSDLSRERSNIDMGQLCDFCGEQRSIVYCRSDAASLCLSCDHSVHSANALSMRHLRTLLCNRCNVQPAVVGCIEEKVSLCEYCDWNGHGGSGSVSGHKRQAISCYSGCPSAAEISRIWSFVDGFPSGDSNCEHGSTSTHEGSVSNCLGPAENNGIVDLAVTGRMHDLEISDKFDAWFGSSSIPALSPVSCDVDQAVGSMDSTIPKVSFPGTKGLGLCPDDPLYEEFKVDDVDFGFENYEELFGISEHQSGHLFEDTGIDGLFATKNMPTAGTSNQGDSIAEASSIGQPRGVRPACSNTASADSLISIPRAKSDATLCFPEKQAYSSLSLSFSGLTGESSASDYQDSGISSMLLMGEPPWCPPGTERQLPTASRDNAVMRYKEKRKTRKFDKKVRYASRKARADVRERVKGRFVKAAGWKMEMASYNRTALFPGLVTPSLSIWSLCFPRGL